jgi:ribosomal protein S18 acetylase RimI-like enzyme
MSTSDLKQLLYTINLRPKMETDIPWLRAHLAEEWGGEPVLVRKHAYFPSELPGFVAVMEGPGRKELVGEVTYSIEKHVCEIVTLSSLHEQMGIGSALFNYVETIARAEGCRRLQLITTTDNLNAIGFYQKRGMRIVAVYPDALEDVRKQKPHIPRIGMNDIPLLDELRLEKRLS